MLNDLAVDTGVENRLRRILSGFSLVVVTLWSSCSPVVYSNTGYAVPLFKNPGEVMLNVSVASTEYSSGVGVQAATAVDSSWAVMSGFYYLANQNSLTGDTYSDWLGSGSQFDIGGGRFVNFGAKKRGVGEVFAGAGLGTIHNHSSDQRLDLKFVKSFFQPSIGISGRWMDFAFTPRIALISYISHTVSLDDPTRQSAAERWFRERKNTLAFEPGIMMRGGYRGVTAQLLMSLSTFSHRYDYSGDQPNIDNQYFSFGVNYLISRRDR